MAFLAPPHGTANTANFFDVDEIGFDDMIADENSFYQEEFVDEASYWLGESWEGHATMSHTLPQPQGSFGVEKDNGGTTHLRWSPRSKTAYAGHDEPERDELDRAKAYG